jgi:tetratricopeptide (TPR) repeat protein
MRRYDEALHDFERTLKLTPNDAHAYGLRALVWAKKGDRSRALADFDEAIRLAPQNEELYRSHRDRVLAESSRAPIEGGDFSILKNPFVLLGLPPTAAPAMVKEAYEDAVEGEVDDVDVLMRAQQTLLTPRLPIEAEVGGFLDIDPRLASQIVSDIRSGAPIDEISEQVGKLREAIADEASQAGAVSEAAGTLPLLRDRLRENEVVQATFILVFSDYLYSPHAADWWTVFSRMDRPAFQKEAEALVHLLAVLRQAAAATGKA